MMASKERQDSTSRGLIKEGLLVLDAGFDIEEFISSFSGKADISSSAKVKKEGDNFIISAEEDLRLTLRGDLRYKIEIKERKEITIIENHIEGIFRSEIIVGKGSKVNLITMQEKEKKSLVYRDIKIGENAKVNIIDLSKEARFKLIKSRAFLEAKNSESYHNCVFYAKDKCREDEAKKHFAEIESIHIGEDTKSDILVKTVVGNGSKALIKGNVEIDEKARGSTGYQKIDALVLDGLSQADAIPNLNIRNNEVKCSHGTSIGRISKEKIFYMMSKGISKDDAIEMIVEGFIMAVLDKIPKKAKEGVGW